MTYLVSILTHASKLALGIWEEFDIELKVTPLEAFHPEAIVVKHFYWYITLFHAFQEAVDSLFAVVRGEGRC